MALNAGSGKTSLVTSFAKYYAETHPNHFTLVHVVSASPTSTDIREVLLRVCRELEEEFDLASGLEETDYQTIRETFARKQPHACCAPHHAAKPLSFPCPGTLEVAGSAAKARRTHVLLVLDAVNQLSNFYNAHSMDWFPTYMPPGIQALISTIPDSPCLASLSELLPPLTVGVCCVLNRC